VQILARPHQLETLNYHFEVTQFAMKMHASSGHLGILFCMYKHEKKKSPFSCCSIYKHGDFT
jgi:hypothetical protein